MTLKNTSIKLGWFTTCWISILLLSCKNEKPQEDKVLAELPFTMINLQSLDDFKDHQHWMLAGDVVTNIDGEAVKIKEGKGIIVNDKGSEATLMTAFTHNDLDLKADFLLTKGAVATVQFKGKYKIALTDSWKSGTDGACGTLYIKSDSMAAPLINACKAPGLWQHLFVKFKAPDQSGKATIEAVYLNGKLIHKNVALVREGGGPGPLVLTTEKGTAAFRNIEYKSYDDDRIHLQDITFGVYKELLKNLDTVKNLTPLRTGNADSLHWSYGDKRALTDFKGTMQVPVEGKYVFMIRGGGPCALYIDDKQVVYNNGTREYTQPFYGNVSLKQGEHSFEVAYSNYDESLVLEYEGPGIPVTALTSPSSERLVHEIPPMALSVNQTAIIQEGFFTHHGKVNTYNMSVGTPDEINYAYDMTTFNILSVWRGKFIDVSNMWVERGESQMQIPLGAPLELAGVPPLLQLTNKSASWTDTVAVDDNFYTSRGYRLKTDGLPVFFYTYKGVKVEDEVSTAKDQRGLVRTIQATFTAPVNNIYYLLGIGRIVDPMERGVYAMDDKEYYIAVGGGTGAPEIVKAGDGRYELRLPISAEQGKTITFSYSIIW